MDVILHIGAHRTATTAMQHHMSQNRAAMAEAGVIYWGPKIARGGLFRGAIGGVEGVMAWQERRFAGRCAMRAEALRQSGAHALMISDENMIGSLRGSLEHTQLYVDAAHRIKAYANGFQRHRVTVGVCVRNYVDWWTSAMAFRLLRGGPMPLTTLREYLVTQPRRWRHVVEDVARALPDARVVVWTYEARADAPHSLVEELTGFASAPLNAPRRNGRPPVPALRELMVACNLDPTAFDWPEGQFMPFTSYERDALDALYTEDLAWLHAGAGGFADFIDAPLAQTEAPTAHGRGYPIDGENRHLA